MIANHEMIILSNGESLLNKTVYFLSGIAPVFPFYSFILRYIVIMRASQFFIITQKEVPAEAELISHQLLIRAGYIRRLGSGLYTLLPIALRVLQKIGLIIKDEMEKAGFAEILMPAIQPAELWQETGRWDDFGPQMLKMTDRHGREFCFGPTHEEVITFMAQKELHSYRQLPAKFYQVQIKFRDEIRPRFGIMRSREFLMKDAYSFDATYDDLQKTYQDMYQAYSNIFTRLGLDFRVVAADPGAIGGDGSHEFHVLANSGEDKLAFSDTSDYATNVELAEAIPPEKTFAGPLLEQEIIETPKVKTCEQVADFFKTDLSHIVKTIAVVAEGRFYLLLIRADHELNEVKVAKLPGLTHFRFASEEEIKSHLNCPAGFIGPVGVDPDIQIIMDCSVSVMGNFICGANKAPYHLINVNFDRDIPTEKLITADIRNVVEGDPSPDGKGVLSIKRGIEVGHIFQLRTKYSKAMNASFLDEAGKSQLVEMGCYGIGVTRIIGAAIEQCHDEKGIIFPDPMAPFSVALAPINMGKSERVAEVTETLYQQLKAAGVDVLFDDRQLRTGAMLADLELLGIPRRIVIGDRGLDNGFVEYQARRDSEAQNIPLEGIVEWLKDKIQKGE